MGPGDLAFFRWLKRYVNRYDAERICRAYKKAKLVAVDNRAGTFYVLDFDAVTPDALEAAAENLRPSRRRRWNVMTDDERARAVAAVRAVPDQWEKQERVELARDKLDARKR